MRAAVVINSCDLYKDCWLPMVYSLKKYWADCPYPIYIISNNEDLQQEGVTFIKVGPHRGFGSNMNKALSRIDAEYVILLLDDYFLGAPVNARAIDAHIKHCKEQKVDFLKIDARELLTRDSLRIGNSIYCENPVDVTYSINTAVAIWKKEILKTLSVDGFSPWDFERKIIPYMVQNKIAIKSEIIHSSATGYGIKTIGRGGAVYRGMWTVRGVEFLKENGFSDLLGRRKHQWNISLLSACYNKLYTHKSFLRYPVAFLMRVILKLNTKF